MASGQPQLHAPAAMSTAAALVYEQPGEPSEVLKLKRVEVPQPAEGQVLLRFLKAPINPSDINTIQGKYPLKPQLPATPGHEGVAEVIALGAKVEGLSEGDHVVPLEPGQGTWRSRAVCSAASFWRVPDGVPLDAAATMCINPTTALAMLERFVELKAGDVVIQNGATSAVGQAVIQLAKAKGLQTINVIRDRPNWDETVAWLTGLGADVVTTEDKLVESLKHIARPSGGKGGAVGKLGLNCVGGSAALAVAKGLCEGGTLVTYGGMSMQPVSIPTSLLIFKDLTLRGFWLSGRFARNEPGAQRELLARVAQHVLAGELSTRTTTFPLDKWQEALAMCSKAHKEQKVLLEMPA